MQPREPTERRGPKGSVRFKSDRLKEARTRLGWTREELAKRSGYHKKTIARAEDGYSRIQIRCAQDICIALNEKLEMKISLEELLLPDHADVYCMPGGNKFVRKRNLWLEYKGDEIYAVFNEFMINNLYLVLVCTRRKKEGRSMLVRIPLDGGEVEWTWENALEWESFEWEPFTVATKKL